MRLFRRRFSYGEMVALFGLLIIIHALQHHGADGLLTIQSATGVVIFVSGLWARKFSKEKPPG